jgi:RNA polymerase sigma-70 factor (ECF subfamily)
VEETVDRELVLRLQEGDLESLGDLFDRHRHLVYRTALAICGDPEMASDLLQEVFLRLNRFAHRIDPERPLEPWLYRMTANLSYTWLKKRNRWLRLVRDITDRFVVDKRPSPHALAERDETWQWIRQAIMALPIQQRLVVVLYYVNELSIQEISEVLEIPAGTIKSRLYYARKQLKTHLSSQEEALLRVLYENA